MRNVFHFFVGIGWLKETYIAKRNRIFNHGESVIPKLRTIILISMSLISTSFADDFHLQLSSPNGGGYAELLAGVRASYDLTDHFNVFAGYGAGALILFNQSKITVPTLGVGLQGDKNGAALLLSNLIGQSFSKQMLVLQYSRDIGSRDAWGWVVGPGVVFERDSDGVLPWISFGMTYQMF